MFTRRDFMIWTGRSAAALGLSELGLFRLEQALASESSPPLIWLHGSSCTGCSIAALNAVTPTSFGDLILNRVSAKYDSVVMAAGADLAIRTLDRETAANDGRFILVVEGGVPTVDGGRHCVIGVRDGAPITLLRSSSRSSRAASTRSTRTAGRRIASRTPFTSPARASTCPRPRHSARPDACCRSVARAR